ncbi:MAG: hypothetical protein EOO61_17800 [Hymenobacter sp.]|nr:MAG: hypothetical protein EOO61_17800 [Hymenobacter sp.]
MVILLLTAIDSAGEFREFSCQLPDIDSGFAVLTTIASLGQTLVKARLLEESSWTSLPHEAFDELPVLPIIKELEKDWQQLLNESPE